MQQAKLVVAMASLLAFTTHAAQGIPTAANAGQSTGLQQNALALAKAAAQGQVLMDENFDNLSNGALPAGWTKAAWNKGTVTTQNGHLYIDGRAHSTSMTAAILPTALEAYGNYRIDMVFTYEAANDIGRWGSVMYRTSAAGNTPAHEPYFQFAIRQNATAANGTELAYRNGAAWNVTGTKPFTEAISKDKTYTSTVIVYGNRVRQYLNNVLLHDAVLPADLPKGGIGIQTAGTLMRVESIKVTEQLTPLPALDMPVAVQDTGTKASMAPTLVQAVTSDVAVTGSGASNALMQLDSALQLSDSKGNAMGTLQAYYQQEGRNTIPLLRVQDMATVDALLQFSSDVHNLADVTLLSGDVQVLAYARSVLPAVRTAVDFSARGLGTSTQDLLTISGDTNRAGAKIALLPANLVTRDLVSRLQRLLLTVWASSDAQSAEQAAQVLTTGVNGVVSAHSPVFAEVLKKLPANTLLRKPLVVGHRGMPADFDENTLASALGAVAAGADAVENDIYLTSDNHLVIMHDATVDRTTNGTGAIESMTLAQVKALRTKGTAQEVPTMREYFKAFKGVPITHVIELKSGNAGLVAQLKKEMAEEGVAEQSVAISFDANQLKRSAQQIPELTVGYLNSNADTVDVLNSVRNVLNATQQNSSTYNPSYGGLKRETMEAAKHRGTTFWPWTVNSAADFYKYYSWGTHGITTDSAKWAKAFPVEIVAKPAAAALALNQPVALDVDLTTQGKETQRTQTNELVHLGGTATALAAEDGSLRFTTAGTAVVMPGYRFRMDGTSSYVIMANPMTLIVGDGSQGVVPVVNSAAAGNVACSSAVPGQSSTCTVTPQPGYAVVGAQTAGTCPAGTWDAGFTAYTTGVISSNCKVNFQFAALPANVSLSAAGVPGVLQAKVSGGGTGLWAFDTSSAPSVAAGAGAPANLAFPYGVLSLRLTGGQAGQAAQVELTYPADLPAGAKYYKFGKTHQNAAADWYEYPNAQISGNKVVLTLTDGQNGDDDLLANGVISDPGGVAVAKAGPMPSANAVPVPTLGHGALLLLSSGLGALAWRRKRRDAAKR